MKPALRIFEHNLLVYRRTWRGSVFVSFLSPLFFLTAMGIGLGGLVRQGAGSVDGVAYRDFLAPGLLVAAAMQTASIEMTYPVMSKVYWQRTYEAMLSTPVAVRDVLFGEIGWILFRLLLVACSFFVVIELFGASRSPGGPMAIGAGVLTGLAFATPILAFAATRTSDNGFAVLSRFVITPLFLLGGTFFPITRLAPALQAVAQVTPLYHGVALSRSLTLGRVNAGEAAVHVLVLLAYTAAGTVAAYITLHRRLVK